MGGQKRRGKGSPGRDADSRKVDSPLRITGGKHGGRKLEYSGDPRTRPMKERLRQTIFDLLGESVKGTTALDLFAGTGALGLEAVSRGATGAIFFEQHLQALASLRTNIETLELGECCHIVPGNTFLSVSRIDELPTSAWLAFCSPPYEFYRSRGDELKSMVQSLLEAAPAGSTFVVEAEAREDAAVVLGNRVADIRQYGRACLAICRIG